MPAEAAWASSALVGSHGLGEVGEEKRPDEHQTERVVDHGG
jgi:hypothetical protein